MRLILISVAVAIAAMPATGCGGTESKDGRRTVVASFYPLAYAAAQVGGPAEVSNLTPPGAEPHDLEVSPRDVQRIRSADLVLLLGHGFQPQLEDAAREKSALRLLDAPGLDRFSNDDPHVWLDPLRFAVLVKAIARALDRDGGERSMVARLRALDRDFRRGLSDCARREVVTSHEAFAYLTARYGLEQVAITGLSPEAEPAPRDLQRVIKRVRSTGATTIFFETLASPRIADAVARATGARTAVLNPIEGLTAAQARRGDDYFSLMSANLKHLRAALGCS